MRKLLVCILFLFLVSCARMVVTTTSVAEKSTSSLRTSDQLKFDLKLASNLKDTVENNKKKFFSTYDVRTLGTYEIKVVEGNVLVAGLVNDDMTKQFLLDKIGSNLKIRNLYDEISVEPSVKRHWLDDFFLKRSISLKMLFKRNIRSINYEFSVINGRVYIIGIARNKTELETITGAISTVKGVAEVNSYIILADDPSRIHFNN